MSLFLSSLRLRLMMLLGLFHDLICGIISQRSHLFQVQSESALRQARDELERRVVQRTQELAEANARLAQELVARQRVEDTLRERERFIQKIAASLPDHAMVCVPLLAQGQVQGILHLQLSPLADNQGEYGKLQREARQQLALALAEHIALGLSNVQLRETLQQQATQDGLTGLYNRRYLDMALEREMEQARREGRPLSVIMLDIDHFKQFNDSFGHAGGDALLAALGAMIQSSVRQGDTACRYGGEELAIVLPGAGLEDAWRRAEDLRDRAARLPVIHEGRVLRGVTLSLGVAAFPLHGVSGQAVIQVADEALYRAKAAGRNCVVVGSIREVGEACEQEMFCSS